MVGTQNVWQASVPIEVDIDYDIPIANRKSLLQKRSASDRIAKTLEASCGEPLFKRVEQYSFTSLIIGERLGDWPLGLESGQPFAIQPAIYENTLCRNKCL